MKNLYLTLSILCLLFTAHAQDLHVEWTKFIGGNGDDVIYDAVETSDKGAVFTGFTDSHNDGDIPANPPDTASSGTPSNVLIGKLDSNRQLSWVKVYGGFSSDYGAKIRETEDGYIILASTNSSDGTVTNYHGNGDCWLIKIDKQGNLQWQKAYGGPLTELPVSVAITPDKGYISLAASNSAGDDVPAQYSASQFVFDWFVFKVDSSGNLQWAKTLGGTGDESYFGAILAADNGYYLASSSLSRDHECTDISWHGLATQTLYDCYLLRLDSAGNVMWNRSYGGSSGELTYDAKWEESDSSIIMVAATHSNDYMVQDNHGENDIWVFKTDKNGMLQWSRTLGGTLYDDPCNIILDPDGGYMVSGKASGTVPVPPGYFSVYSNMWLFKLDTAGNEVTRKIIGGTGPDWPACVIHYARGYGALGFTQSPVFAEGANTANHGPKEDGYFSVIDYFPLSVSQSVTAQKKLKIYPNPAQELVNILLPTDSGGRITVFAGSGKQMYVQKVKNGISTILINTKDWIRGSYLVQWQGVDEKVTAQFVIN